MAISFFHNTTVHFQYYGCAQLVLVAVEQVIEFKCLRMKESAIPFIEKNGEIRIQVLCINNYQFHCLDASYILVLAIPKTYRIHRDIVMFISLSFCLSLPFFNVTSHTISSTFSTLGEVIALVSHQRIFARLM